MNNETVKSLLMPFYFGSIGNQERTLVERELLTDPEILIDYLDLKRNIESAEVIPQAPSKALWLRLKGMEPRKKTILSFSLGAAIAASLFICWIFISKPKPSSKVTSKTDEVLFDSNRELPVSSNVL